MKKLSIPTAFLFLFSFLFFSLSTYADNIRGTEKDEAYLGDSLRSVAAAGLYVPQQAVKGTLSGVSKTADVLSDKDFIERVKDILYLYERELLWFPILDYASGFRPEYGAGLYYKKPNGSALFRGAVHDADLWSSSLKLTHKYLLNDSMEWKNSILGILEKHDDLHFYGFGADPKKDPRNQFFSNQDYGTFTEDRRKIQWSSNLSPQESWGLTYLGYYQRRAFQDHGSGNDDLRNVFDTSQIPGFTNNAPVEQIYNEMSLHADTRNQKKMMAPGFRGEIYSGFSTGIDQNHSELFRSGFDAASFIPVSGEERLLVPRAVLDLVENLDDEPIPFSEYPRQHTFRGVSQREMIRSERVSFVPSLEYQWPLSPFLAGSVFFDYLAVGSSVTKLNWDDGLWAIGCGLNLHILKQELGRLEFAGGSEGLQLGITFGRPLHTNERSKW